MEDCRAIEKKEMHSYVLLWEDAYDILSGWKEKDRNLWSNFLKHTHAHM